MRSIVIILLFLVSSCGIYKPIPVVENKYNCSQKIDSLKLENKLLRVEIDYLKNKLSNLRKLHELDTILNKNNYEK